MAGPRMPVNARRERHGPGRSIGGRQAEGSAELEAEDLNGLLAHEAVRRVEGRGDGGDEGTHHDDPARGDTPQRHAAYHPGELCWAGFVSTSPGGVPCAITATTTSSPPPGGVSFGSTGA